MKRIFLVLLAVVLSGRVFAQGAGGESSPARSPVVSPTPLPPPVDLSPLTAEEKARIAKAGQAAQQDPEVIASGVELNDAVKAATVAMIAKDPTLKPLLDKIEAASAPGAERPQFSSGDYDHLSAGRASIAGTPEAATWQKATLQYREAVHKAMLAADPTLDAVFKKLEARAAGGGPPAAAATPGAGASPGM
jgi:hypothetical protein